MIIRGAALSLLAVLSLSAVDVELTLNSGQTVCGEVLKDGDDSITIRRMLPTRDGSKPVDATYRSLDIAKRTELPPLLARYESRKALTPDSAPALCDLAQWCYENCLREPARTHAVRALELEPDNTWAKNTLDSCGFLYVTDNNQWVDEASYLKANGLAKLDGKLVPAAYADARIALSKAMLSRDTLNKQLAEKTAIVRDKSGGLDAADAKAKQGQATIDRAKAALDSAQEALDAAKTAPPARNETPAKRTARLEALTNKRDAQQDRLADTKKSVEAARRQAFSDRILVNEANATLPGIEASLKKARDAVAAAIARLPAADPAVVAASEKPTPPPAVTATKPADQVTKPPDVEGAKPPDKPPVRRLRQGDN